MSRFWRNHDEERPVPPTPVVVRVEPPTVSPPSGPVYNAEDWPETPLDEMTDINRRDPRWVYRYCLLRGWPHEAALNWAAFVVGLEVPGGEPWSMRQIDQMRFYRAAWGNGRLRG